jgi:S-DNA-T family DNA segregation ATPase FtsK/SpoIIIE
MTWEHPVANIGQRPETLSLKDAFRASQVGPLRSEELAQPLPTVGTEPLDRWQRWADEHDYLTAQFVQREAQLEADERAVAAEIQNAKTRLDQTVNSAPKDIQKAWSNERRSVVAPSAADPISAQWTPGGLCQELQAARATLDQLLSKINSNYSAVAKRSAMLRGAAVRVDLIPSYEAAVRFIRRLEAQLEPVKVKKQAAREDFQRDSKALALAACRDLTAINVSHQTSLGKIAPSGHDFGSGAWDSWSPPSKVRESLWYWQSVPEGLAAKIAGPECGVDSGSVRDSEVVGDFRTVPGFLWWNTKGQENTTASSSVRSMILRLMASIPPGKARFTFIDPLGSGNNVAPFLELADWDPLLVDTKAWCQQREISEKLSELNAHLELVIQKYLKGRFESIEDYNVAAGEVAEPYRFVVVFDFPAQFDEQSAHLLARLVQNGQRCGVYVLVVHNGDQSPPYGVNLDVTLRGLHRMPLRADIARSAGDLAKPAIAGQQSLIDGRHLPPPPPVGNRQRAWLRSDTPPELRFDRDAPSRNLFTRVMLSVGESGRGSNDIVVSPERVSELVAAAMNAKARSDLPVAKIPVRLDDVSTWWTGDTSRGLAVPIGRSGARDAAMFAVDTAILSGGLVVGRPGSGKSTLMHALICGAATWYSPDEVEMYLLDFKQGVEFLSYGELALPHARCVAIESEREFGVAILESVAAELSRRAQVFKDTGPGIVNITDWRTRTSQVMPRILVVIDEFQELLNRSDSLANRAAQLLDNLIRQGRAFGIHVLLGSQSLSSIDTAGTGVNAVFRLLPIRIVLPSDSSDATAALGDRNDAAQYLTRQGEGVYNDAGGNPDHNVRFQGTLISDAQRHAIIAAARKRADDSGFTQRPRVFNGQVPAQIDLAPERFVEDMRAAGLKALRIPIGTPVTLDPDVVIEMTREAGANLAFACRDDELTDGFGVVALAALAAQIADQGGRLHFVDCTSADSSTESWIQPLLTSGVFEMHRPRALPELLARLRLEVSQRLDADETRAAPVVVVVWGVHRARDLDPEGAGFGAVGSSEAPDSASDMEWIIRNGPEVGFHMVIWADSPASLGRRLTRAAIRDCSWRVSAHLNDMDADRFEVKASTLKPNQLACANVEADRHWRVRGYARPSAEWIKAVAQAI